MKRFLFSVGCAALMAASVWSAPVNRGVIATAEEMAQGGGFYWYDDFAPEDVNKTHPIRKKVRVTPQQKAKMSLMERMVEAMERNNELQEKILAKLEYAFPRTVPEFTVNAKTGEKCRSNSNKDCFVMPVVAEAQQSVPVLAEMLRNPTAENVRKYLEWQGVYLNQAFTVGHGFQLMSLQYEREASGMDGTYYTQMPGSGNLQNDVAQMEKSAVIMRLRKKLGVIVMLGKTRTIEREINGLSLMRFSSSVLSRLDDFAYVYESEAAKERLMREVDKYRKSSVYPKFKAAKSTVSPQLFKRYKISVTPAVVAFYKADDGRIVWQKLGYASMSPSQATDVIYNFLRFHKIIKPGTINEELAYQIADQLRSKGDVDEALLNQIEIDESHLKVPESQIASHKKESA